MSKDYCGFSNEDGETAFLAGVVDVLSDNLSMALDNTNALDADIFLVVDNNISLLNDAVRNDFMRIKISMSAAVSLPTKKLMRLIFNSKNQI